MIVDIVAIQKQLNFTPTVSLEELLTKIEPGQLLLDLMAQWEYVVRQNQQKRLEQFLKDAGPVGG